MDLRVLRYEVDDGVALVTLDRPERLNSWTTRMATEYRWALGTADADPDVGAVVVTGAGRGFCAGADTKALDRIVEAGDYRAASPEPDVPVPAGPAPRPELSTPFSFPLGLATPVIAAINGAAAGVGFVVACFTDIRFAAAGAKFTTSFGRLGLPAEYGVSWLLPRLVGPGHAADLLFSSRIVLAEEAAAMGLVNRVLPADELLPFTLDYAHRLVTEISPSSMRVMKRQLWAGLIDPLDAVAAEAEELMVRMTAEPDFTEGTVALAEKRPPRFRTR
jgi:enoyl-CoA hydratase/carnithine racemase